MPQRVAFVLPDMRGGGTERLTVDLMAGMLRRGIAVDLVLQAIAGDLMPLVPAGVRVIELRAPRLRHALAPLRRYYRSERPVAAVAAMWPLTVIAVAAAVGLSPRPRIVVSDHCPLQHQYAGQPLARLSLRATIPLAYRLADGVATVSQGLAAQIASLGALPARDLTVIPNPVPPPLRSPAGAGQLWPPAPTRRVLAVGALKQEKNFALLLEAFAQVAAAEDAVLTIVGEGLLRPALEEQVRRLGLSGRVELPGFTPTPGDWYASADVFVLSSDYEGFGNVLVEAMHCGLSIVSTDCPTGPEEILGGGRWGRLVPPGDAAALAAAIVAALRSPADPARQRARAAEFSVDRAVDAYARLLGC